MAFETRLLKFSVSATRYAIGDVVDAAKEITLGLNTSALVRSVSVLDYQETADAPSISLLLFRESPTGVVADNAASTLADSSSLLGLIDQGTAAYKDVGQMKVQTLAQSCAGIGLVVPSNAQGKVWALAIINTTSSFTGAAEGAGIDVHLGLETFN